MSAEEVLKAPKWPEKWPFYDDDFNRMDETSDGDFYSQPRLVYHIGELRVQTSDVSVRLCVSYCCIGKKKKNEKRTNMSD